MKISFDIDCTPAEARAFLGLPDLGPLHEETMAALRTRMKAALDAMTPEALLKQWLPGGAPGFEQIQKAFWDQFGAGAKKP